MAATKKRIKLGYHSNTGQYRKFIKGKMYYFGSDEKTALARYSFFLETGLVFKSGYRQFCRVENGRIIPVGRTIEESRRYLPAVEQHETNSQADGQQPIKIRFVRDVGDAYCEWLHLRNKSAHSIDDTVRAFQAIIKFPGCGDIPIDQVDKAYFLRWRNHCHLMIDRGERQPTWANKRLAFVKAAFSRCDKEGWIVIPGLWEMLSSLEKASGPPRERLLFEPEELRAVIEAADLRLKTAIMLAINAGLGNSDIGEANWKYVTKKRIGKQTETRFVMPRGKTWGIRRTPLWPETVKLLDEWRTQLRDNGLPNGDENFIWTTRYGTPIVYTKSHEGGPVTIRDNLQPEFANLLKAVGIYKPGLTFYSIRHSGSTWATDYGGEDAAIKEGNQFYLGNAPGEIWKNYSHGVPPSLKRTVKVIHKALFDS